MSSKTHSSSHSNSNRFECFTRWKHCYAVALRSISPTTKTSNQFEFSCRCHFQFSFSSFSGANEEKNRRHVTSHNGEAQKLKSFFSALNWCKRWKETLFLLSRLVRCLHLHSLSNVILTYFSCCNFQCATHSCLICFTIYFQPKCYVLFRKWSFYHVFYHIKSTRNHNGEDRNRTSSHASKFFFSLSCFSASSSWLSCVVTFWITWTGRSVCLHFHLIFNSKRRNHSSVTMNIDDNNIHGAWHFGLND